MWCATPNARCWWCGTEVAPRGANRLRPFRDKTFRLVGLDLVPFVEHASAEIGIGVPERARRIEVVDRDQHLLDFRPVPLQRHRIAPRGPAIAEADHAADVRKPNR